ncbi:hypothetical protein [Oscillatoria sp. HE19RPO]|uniref:hypothetical protein n=1 Tax=Oscillatoria sp. HE19RPO TaxID=2954806 RepID=UPI0020C21AD2|nr:hypothetical protein [Oscillatoria sp. HE19RPO]
MLVHLPLKNLLLTPGAGFFMACLWAVAPDPEGDRLRPSLSAFFPRQIHLPPNPTHSGELPRLKFG